tara:strand:+ start:3235 stop:3402 length:168 start_codon:yes stop_codon:yes gene_type:complete
MRERKKNFKNKNKCVFWFSSSFHIIRIQKNTAHVVKRSKTKVVSEEATYNKRERK